MLPAVFGSPQWSNAGLCYLWDVSELGGFWTFIDKVHPGRSGSVESKEACKPKKVRKAHNVLEVFQRRSSSKKEWSVFIGGLREKWSTDISWNYTGAFTINKRAVFLAFFTANDREPFLARRVFTTNDQTFTMQVKTCTQVVRLHRMAHANKKQSRHDFQPLTGDQDLAIFCYMLQW